MDEVGSIGLFAVHEQRMLEKGTRRLPIPVLLVSGSLGSGKTTLLNHILNNKLNLRVTCLVNDLAELNIDSDVLVHRDAARKTVRLSNGCACHSLGPDLESEMWQVLQETDGADRIDYVVIETSGVAEPASLIEALERRFGKLTRARLDAVVAVVDGDVLAHHLMGNGMVGGSEGTAGVAATVTAESGTEGGAAWRVAKAGGASVWRQLQCADVVLLNKTDLLDPELAAETARLVETAAPWAKARGVVSDEQSAVSSQQSVVRKE
jgi:G3E family GTPase